MRLSPWTIFMTFIQGRDELSEEPSGPRRRPSYPHWQRVRPSCIRRSGPFTLSGLRGSQAAGYAGVLGLL